MKKVLINILACLTLAVIAQPSWAQDIYRCVGASGEVFFKESPCESRTYAETKERAAQQEENRKSLEAVKRRIMKVKREIMDLDRFFEFNVAGLKKSDAAIFTATYEEDRKVLTQQLAVLEAEQTVLVEESFQFVTMTGAHSGQ